MEVECQRSETFFIHPKPNKPNKINSAEHRHYISQDLIKFSCLDKSAKISGLRVQTVVEDLSLVVVLKPTTL